MLRKIVSLLAVTMLLVTPLKVAEGHFVYVYEDGGNVNVVFGEGPEPDQAKFLNGLAAMKAYGVVDGVEKELKFQQQTDGDLGWFEASIKETGPIVNVTCPYGVFNRGGSSLLLDYSGKYVRFDAAAPIAKPTAKLALDLVPSFDGGQLKVGVFFKGLPLANADVKLMRIDNESFDTNSDETGTALLEADVRYFVRATHVVKEAGEVDGEKYSEKRYYCTMVLQLGAASDGDANGDVGAAEKVAVKPNSGVSLVKIDEGFQDFPRGMTSFGATMVGNKLFVAGGKSGRAHSYARSYQNRDIYCLDLESKKWETVGQTLGLQGLAIVQHDGKVVRIGGLEARNEEGEEHELRSLAAVKAFDPATKEWTKWPSLPQGRSSFDACSHQGHVYVVGGWTLEIGQDSQWATEMLVMDATGKEPSWQAIAAPFQNRALAVRAFEDKIFAIGGINEDGPTDEVHVFDIKTQTWSEGPDVPVEGGILAFGCSSVVLGGRLLVSTYDGGVFQLSDDQDSWEKIHQLETGRFFHQMIPVGKSSFGLVGGASMKEGRFQNIDVYQVVDEKK